MQGLGSSTTLIDQPVVIRFPGARSALPMVGEVFQQALRNRWIEPGAEFDIPRSPPPQQQKRQLQWERPVDAVSKIFRDVLRRIFR